MLGIYLAIKDKLFSLRRKRLRYSFLSLLVFIFIFLFAPLVQIAANRQIAENELIKNSGIYDYVLRLPNHEQYQTFGRPNFRQNDLREDLQKWFASEKDFTYDYVQRYRFVSPQNQILLNIETVTPETRFNRIVFSNTDSRLPEKNGEAVLSLRFYEQHKASFSEADSLLKQFNLKIVGQGMKLNSYSFGHSATFQLDQILKSDVPTQKLYGNGGWLYVTPEQFNQWVSEDWIINYENLVYLKINSGVNFETIIKEIKDKINIETGFIPDAIPFIKDLNSGLKMFLNTKAFWICLGIFAFSFLVLLFLIFFAADRSIKQNKTINKNLKVLGYSNAWISFTHAMRDFLFLWVVALLSFVISLPFYYFFSNLTLSSVNLTLPATPLSSWGFLVFVFALPMILALEVFLLGLYRFQFLFQNRNYHIEEASKSWTFFQKIWNFFHKINFFPASRWKIFSLFLFQNGLKKFLTFVLSIFLILLSFLLIFLRTSFNNYAKSQTSFVDDSVSSLTELENSLRLDKSKKIESNLEVFSQEQTDISYDSESEEIIRNENDLESVITKLLVFEDTFSTPKIFLRDETELAFINNIFESNQFDKIYLGRAPYILENDLPGLILKTEIFSKKLNLNFNSEILFMSDNPEQNIRDYLKIYENIENPLPEFESQISARGNFNADENKNFYTLVSTEYRDLHGYQTGDLIEMRFKVNKQYAAGTHTFRIAGFIAPQNLQRSVAFVDYRYLKTKKMTPRNEIYNLIITRNAPKHLNRFAVLDVVRTRRNFNPDDLQISQIEPNKFIIANQKSLNLQEVKKLSSYHFEVFEIFFSVVLGLNIIFVLLLLFMANVFLFDDNRKMFINLRLQGYKIYELTLIFVFFFIIQLLIAGGIAFGISYGAFNLISTQVSFYGISLQIFGATFYLLYMFIALLCLLFLIVAYQLQKFRKQKLVLISNE